MKQTLKITEKGVGSVILFEIIHEKHINIYLCNLFQSLPCKDFA